MVAEDSKSRLRDAADVSWMPCKNLHRGLTPTLVTYLIPRVSLLPLPWSEKERRETLGTRLVS